MSPDETHRLALAVEALRGSVETGFAAVRGDINGLSIRETRTASDVNELRAEVEGLKDRRFPLPVVGGVMGFAGVVVSLVAALGKG